MAVIILLYYLIKVKIKHSIHGPTPEASIDFPTIYFKTIKLSYIGLFLIVLNNFFTHMSALVFPEKEAYMFVGAKSVINYFGFIIYFYSLVDFQFVFLNIKNELKIVSRQTKLPVKVVIFITAWFTLLIILKDNIVYFAFYFVISFISVIIVNILYLKRSDHKHLINNRLLEIRLYLIRFLTFLAIFSSTMAMIIFFPSPNESASSYLTRNSEVEYLIFLSEMTSIFSALILFSIISFPRWLRLIFKISDIEYYHSRDTRTDFGWHTIDRQLMEPEGNLVSSSFTDTKNKYANHKYLIISNLSKEWMKSEKNRNGGLTDLKKYFNDQEFHSSEVLDEEYVKNIFLKKSDIVCIANGTNQNIYGINLLKRDFGFEVEFKDCLSINSFSFSDENLRFGFLSIIPSPWSSQNRLWLLLSSEEVLKSIGPFILKYGNYFQDRAKTHVIISIVKFPYVDGTIKEIPSSIESPDIPDSKFIKFL